MTDTVVGSTVSRPGPPFRVSFIVLVLGVVLAIPGMIIVGVAFWDTVNGPTYAVPGAAQVHLGSGPYTVYEHTGATRSYGPVNVRNSHGITIDARATRVTGPDGVDVAVRNTSPNETITRNADHYVSAVKFDAPVAGDYVLQIEAGTPGQVLVERPFGDVLRRHTAWLAGIGIGWLTALAGMTMLLVGIIRRGRADRRARVVPVGYANAIATSAPGVAAAGWFADPGGAHRLRYWDGQQWTDHYAD